MDTGPLAPTLPSGTKEHANTHGQDALCPSAKIQKHAAFGIIRRHVMDFCRNDAGGLGIENHDVHITPERDSCAGVI
ncbi:MAG: hypothetical protein WCO51_12070 [bacterium]